MSRQKTVLGALIGAVTLWLGQLFYDVVNNFLAAELGDAIAVHGAAIILSYGMALGIAAFCIGLAYFYGKESKGELETHAEVRLHFYGDHRTPEMVSSTNVWRWYYLRNIIHIVEQGTGRTHSPTITNLFIAFDRPVSVGTFIVRGQAVPKYEVKEFNNRFAIICFETDVPAGTLELIGRA